jgi:cyanophycinase
MMSQQMMTGDSTPLGRGLGLLPNVILDTHFLKRHRNARLAAAVTSFPNVLGVGIDEGAALVVNDGALAQVMGPEKVVIVKAGHSVCETYLLPEDCYDLKNGGPCASK